MEFMSATTSPSPGSTTVPTHTSFTAPVRDDLVGLHAYGAPSCGFDTHSTSTKIPSPHPRPSRTTSPRQCAQPPLS